MLVEMQEIEEAWSRASRRLANLQRLPSGELRAKLRELSREAGYLERRAEDIEGKAEFAKEINELSERKNVLNSQISQLKTRNEILRAGQENRLGQAYSLIEKQILYLLHHDLRRQDAFVGAERVEFSFSSNTLTVNGQSYFSASSRVILRSSFFIGFLFAATADRSFRHPRFCILDTIEDKGMEQGRSHNFQKLIVERSKNATVEHQIIFATAMIAPELNTPEFTVGKISTLDNPTIKISKAASRDRLF